MTSSHPTPSSPFLSRSPRLSNRGGSFVTVDLGKYTRIASLELLNPSFHSKARLTDFRTAAFNLVATIVGGGVLSLPYVFYRVGIFTGLALLILAAIITEFSLYILCSCARRTGGRSYMEIVGHCFGPVSEIFTSVLLVALCGMMMVGYMVLIMGIFTPVVREFFTTSALVELSGEQLEMNILTISLLMVSPFLFKRDLYSLRHVCYIGFCSVCYLAIVISYRSVQNMMKNPISKDDLKFVSSSINDILFGFPICVLAFLSSFNVLSVHGSLIDPTRSRLRRVIRLAVESCFFIFIIFGLAGYCYAYNNVADNIFLSLDPTDPLLVMGRVGMGITIMFVIPMVLLPCREALLTIPGQIYNFLNPIDTFPDMSITDEHTPLQVIDHKEKYGNETERLLESNTFSELDPVTFTELSIHILVTITLVLLAFYAAIAVPGVAVVWSLVGSSVGIFVAFIIPSACYLKIREKKGLRKLNIFAWVLLVFAIIGSVTCTYQATKGSS